MLTDYHMTLNRAGIPVWRPAQPVIGREDEHQTALTNWARMMRTQYPCPDALPPHTQRRLTR